ncbi:GNAT family N-acetyltransferase [Kribbella catacumbae]|uniref:GNAT family N-acetyltransferase n=1 Tax=Kribbella catacumbae TaxID=460086 RepID=UPI0003A366B9|nr:GNAT family N-acetyltransferase [Kribbella catacumbae]
MNQTQVVEPVGGVRTGGLILRRAGHADAESLSGMLCELSDWSLYMRFQTAVGRPPRPTLLEGMLDPNGAAWVAERDCEVVGHAMWAWVKGATVPTAELALIIAESEQRRGLGVRMASEAAQHALAAGAAQLLVMVSAMNDKVLRMVRHRWPTATAERDGSLINFTIPSTYRF